jgi:phage baseplate assembly protein W
MPLERISKDFKDISMSFKVNPLNYDLIALKNQNAIARSIRNIVLTRPGEKFFNPRFGSEISSSLFENMDDDTASNIQFQIRESLSIYENRIELIDVKVSPNYDLQEYNVTVIYSIIGIDALPQQLSFALQSTR